MFNWVGLASKIPTVEKSALKLTFREKAKWTLIILVLFFLLGSITIWGINPEAVAQFEFLEIVFGSRFGSLITLGIGPIVTASIILQLLVGSKIIGWDLGNEEDKKKFAGTQKILTVAFCFITAIAYVAAGAVPPASGDLVVVTFVILELAAGGLIIMFMDEVVSKWGFGSGVSLFIAAGVSKTIFLRIFSPPIRGVGGGVIAAFMSSLNQGLIGQAFTSFLPLIATLIVFGIVVYAQDIRVEIPMSFAMPFGKFAARRWPLKFLYTSNIPVILIAAVIANMQVVGRVLFQRGINILGVYDANGRPISGLMYFLTAPSLGQTPSALTIIIITILAAITALVFSLIVFKTWKKYSRRMFLLGAVIGIAIGSILAISFNLPVITSLDAIRVIVYMSVFVIGSMVFSLFWVNTSGMDAKSVADQFKASSIVIPGFRRDPRTIEGILNKYIPALTVMGGAFIGFLAAFADLTSAIGTGTGILLTVMIIYQLYEQIIAQHYEDMPPALRKFIGE